MLKKLGCDVAVKKINGKSTKVYVGIRTVFKPDYDIDESDCN
jgi:hypothetical protein